MTDAVIRTSAGKHASVSYGNKTLPYRFQQRSTVSIQSSSLLKVDVPLTRRDNDGKVFRVILHREIL